MHVLLNLGIAKEDEIWNQNSVGLFLITGMGRLQQCVHNIFEAMTPGRNPVFPRIVNMRKDSCFRAFQESHAFVYHPAVLEKTLASTLYMKEMIILPLSMLVGHRYLQHGPRSGTDLTGNSEEIYQKSL